MDEKTRQSIEMRRFQEMNANLMAGGVLKEIAKYRKATYDSYIEVGFDREQAMTLLLEDFRRGKEETG